MVDSFQVIVIGGGITGAGVARDCAMRGFRTLLVERRDFSSGTTGACMGMLHGGRRYAVSHPEVTKLSCVESGIIQRIAPHLIFRIPWLIPIHESDPKPLEEYERALKAYDEYGRAKNSPLHVFLTPEETRRIEPSITVPITGAFTRDEPGVNVFRLVLANVLSAAEAGATILNHSETVRVLRDGKRVTGIEVEDGLSGERRQYRGDMVINAAGPWTPYVAELAGIGFRLKPTRGIHILFDRRLTSTAVSCSGVSLLPHESITICGLTDTLFTDPPDEARSQPDEVEYLLSRVETTIPSIRQARIIRTMAGVRPIIDQPGDDERDLSRDYRVYDHEELDGVKGFITIAGGKMVIFRQMAEDVTDLVCDKLGQPIPCETAHTPLYGGDLSSSLEELALGLCERYGLPLHTTMRLASRHGSKSPAVLEMLRDRPAYASRICECEPVTEAEIRYSIHNEWAKTLDDLRRRTRLGTGPCQACHCTAAAAQVLSEERNLTLERTFQEMDQFLQERWKGRYPVLTGVQVRQEQVIRSVYQAEDEWRP